METGGRGAGRAGRALTAVLCVVVFGVAASETVRLAMRGLDAFGVRSPTVGLNLVPGLFEELAAVRARAPGEEVRQVAFLGDSISIQVGADAPTVPRALREAIDAEGASPPVEVHSLAALGAGPFDYYFLADAIADARPDAVVIAFSLQSLGDFFRHLSRPRLSGWIAPRRVPSALFGPIHWIGLSADDLLMNVAIVQAWGGEIWRQLLVVQARLGAARTDLANALGARFGDDGPRRFELAHFTAERVRTRVEGPDGRRDRYDRAAERRHYGAVLDGLAPDHPVLVALADALRVLREAGVPVLVYVNPVNVEHLASLGLPADDRFAGSLATLAKVVRGAGADYLDLHALLLDAAFRDAAGHLGTAAAPDATARIARAVAGPLLALVRPPDPGRSSRTGSR